jgi:Arabinose efflux permease
LFLFLYQGVSILQPVIGHWADRVNLRKVALIGPAVTGIFLSLLGTAPSYPVALLYCLLAGFSSASMHAVLPALVGTYSGKSVGKGMSFWMVGGELGVMVGPMIMTAMIATRTLHLSAWFMAGGIAISLILNYLMRDEPYVIVNNKASHSIPAKKLRIVMLPLGCIVLLRALMRTAAEIYLPVFLLENGAGVWFAGISISILQGFGVLGVVLGGFANDRFGYKPVLSGSLVFSGLGMLAFVFTAGAARIASLAVLGTTSMMMLPIGMAIAQENFPENRSLANGIYLAMVFAINALVGVLTGFLYDQIGGQWTYTIGGLVVLLALPFVFLLPKREKKYTITQEES